MSCLQWKGKRAYEVSSTMVNGRRERKWEFFGEYHRKADGKLAFAERLQKRGSKKNKISLLKDFIPIYLDWARTFKGPVTLRAEKRHLAILSREFEQLRLDQITVDVLLNFQKRFGHWAKTTMRNRLGLLKQILDLAAESNYLTAEPCPFKIVKVPRPQIYEFKPKSVAPELMAKFLFCAQATEPKYYPTMMILFYTGLRPQELLRLQPHDVDFENLFINLPSTSTKTKRARPVPVEPEAAGHLRLLPIKFTHQAIARSFERVCLRIGHKGAITPYTMRHQFGTDLSNQGADIRLIMDMMGHTDIRMTARYTNPDERNKRAAISRRSDVHNELKKNAEGKEG